MNDLPGLRGTWITCIRPCAHHGDHDGEVMTQRTACHGYAHWNTVKLGEPWRPRPHLDHRPLSAPTPMSNLITDRLPTADDGDMDGDVLAKRRPNDLDHSLTVIHWSYVKEGTPWRHTAYWEPKRELPGINGQWVRASAVKPTAADADGDGEVEVYRENSDRAHWHGWDSLDNSDIWRPNTHCDKRPLEPAGQRLPGRFKEFICGCEVLPTREDASSDGDVAVETGCFKRWDQVSRSERWRPWDTKDTRPHWN